jgi:hypothetical protein
MAKKKQQPEDAWPHLQELLEQGAPSFVDELRRYTNGERLGKFAGPWLKDKRPTSRRLLLDYLSRPLNAFRHEALVKRLFKRAEQAGDDEVMAHFLVLFDRSIRRIRKVRHQQQSKRVSSLEAARQLQARWEAEGCENVSHYRSGKAHYVQGFRPIEGLAVPANSTMWRPNRKSWGKVIPLDDKQRQEMEERARLFTPQTRKYLRRRAWRYFRQLGKEKPERYLPGVRIALTPYTDADVPDGLALLDNWGLVHILFHHCPALDSNPGGWRVVPGHTLTELAPAPYLEPLWKQAPRLLLALLKEARSRPVRQWVIFMLCRDHGALLNTLILDELFDLLSHEAAEVAELAADVLRQRPGLEELSVERWLGLLDRANPQALEVLCELIAAKLHPDRVTLEQAVGLASSRPLPVARLGFTWLCRMLPETEEHCQALLGLTDARAEPLRRELIVWARKALSASPRFRPEWVLEYLDSRYPEVRAAGWQWLREEPRARDDVVLWQRLTESPYDDVRMLLVADLEDRVSSAGGQPGDSQPLDPETLRLLWAAVLVNVQRGGRVKPLAVRQLVRRLERRPTEAPQLLPILATALRSVRGPEWRAGLAGVIQLVEHHPDLAPAVRETFPELHWTEAEPVTNI